MGKFSWSGKTWRVYRTSWKGKDGEEDVHMIVCVPPEHEESLREAVRASGATLRKDPYTTLSGNRCIAFEGHNLNFSWTPPEL